MKTSQPYQQYFNPQQQPFYSQQQSQYLPQYYPPQQYPIIQSDMLRANNSRDFIDTVTSETKPLTNINSLELARTSSVRNTQNTSNIITYEPRGNVVTAIINKHNGGEEYKQFEEDTINLIQIEDNIKYLKEALKRLNVEKKKLKDNVMKYMAKYDVNNKTIGDEYIISKQIKSRSSPLNKKIIESKLNDYLRDNNINPEMQQDITAFIFDNRHKEEKTDVKIIDIKKYFK